MKLFFLKIYNPQTKSSLNQTERSLNLYWFFIKPSPNLELNLQYTVVFWGSIIWLKIFAQIQGFIVVKRAKNLELWRLAEASSGIFFCYSFWKNNAGKKILRCTFLHFERKSSCHWSILAIFLVANFWGKLLYTNLRYTWLFYNMNKYSSSC